MALQRGDHDDGILSKLIVGILRRLESRCGWQLWLVWTPSMLPLYRIPAEHAERFTFRRLSLDDALVASRDSALMLSEHFVRAAFARGDLCGGAFDGERLIGYAWKSFSVAPVTENVRIRLLNPAATYSYKQFVHPEYRGLRLARSISRCIDPELVASGVREAVGYIALHNSASRRSAAQDPGFHPIGYAGCLAIGGRCWSFRTGRVRDYLAIETAPFSDG